MSAVKESEMLTIPEAATEFGVNINTLYKAVQRGRIPHIVKFGRWLVSWTDVLTWKQDPAKHRRGNPKYR